MDNIDNNKYYRIYMALCEKATNRALPDGYIERHHIIPKSLGGDDSNANLVSLTAREHFVAHLLLVRFCRGPSKHKMLRALIRMCDSGNTAGRYALARTMISRLSTGSQNPSYGKKWWHDPDSKEIVYQQEAPTGFVLGLPHQRGGFGKGRFWITDGKNDRMVDTDELPQGWSRGRSIPKNTAGLKKATKARHTPEKDQAHSLKMKGRISIHREGKYKMIPPEKLGDYAIEGWEAKNRPPTNAKAFKISGVTYDTLGDAALVFDLDKNAIIYRLKSNQPRWTDWFYI